MAAIRPVQAEVQVDCANALKSLEVYFTRNGAMSALSRT
jgi:hypothetical protein